MNTAADALLGVGHILAEDFAERADLRERLRKILRRTGKLVSTRIETEEKPKAAGVPAGGASSAGDVRSLTTSATGEATTSATDAPAATPLAETAPEPGSAIEAFHPITSEAGELVQQSAANSSAHANGSTGDVGERGEESHAAPVDEGLHHEAIEGEPADDEPSESGEDITAPDGIETTPLAEGIPVSEAASPLEKSAATSDASAPSSESSKPQPPPRQPQKPALSRKEALKREKEARRRGWKTSWFTNIVTISTIRSSLDAFHRTACWRSTGGSGRRCCA